MLSAPSPPSDFQALYAEHHGWLLRWLKRRLHDAGLAGDLAQDTFIKVLVARSSAAIIQPRPFLATIASRLLANHCRREELERAYLDALAHLRAPQVPSPEMRFMVLETLHEIDAMLDALPPLVKRAFLLSQLNGLKYQDIAEQLGVSLITVKRYMKQALVQCLMRVE